MPWTSLAVALLANVAVVLGMRPLGRLQGPWRAAAWLTLGLLTAGIPLVVPASHPPLRFVASLATITDPAVAGAATASVDSTTTTSSEVAPSTSTSTSTSTVAPLDTTSTTVGPSSSTTIRPPS